MKDEKTFSFVCGMALMMAIFVGFRILVGSSPGTENEEEGSKMGAKLVSRFSRADYVEFDGHQYVRYDCGYHGSICHSPKCPCLSGGEGK